jgi:hypothetical protein
MDMNFKNIFGDQCLHFLSKSTQAMPFKSIFITTLLCFHKKLTSCRDLNAGLQADEMTTASHSQDLVNVPVGILRSTTIKNGVNSMVQVFPRKE